MGKSTDASIMAKKIHQPTRHVTKTQPPPPYNSVSEYSFATIPVSAIAHHYQLLGCSRSAGIRRVLVSQGQIEVCSSKETEGED